MLPVVILAKKARCDSDIYKYIFMVTTSPMWMIKHLSYSKLLRHIHLFQKAINTNKQKQKHCVNSVK